MAVKVFTIDMNGGDETSADTAIYFKIYGSADSYTSAIVTTGTSVADANVSVTTGVATVSAEVGTETAFKVTQVDEAGNESVASAEYDTSPASYPAFADSGAQSVTADPDDLGTTNVPYPTTVNANDMLLMLVSTKGNEAITTPSGWNVIASDNSPVLFSYIFLWKRAVGTESGTVAVTTPTGTVPIQGVMHRYTGVVTTGTPVEGIKTKAITNDGGTYFNLDASLSDTRLAVVAYVQADNQATLIQTTGYTQRHFHANAWGGDWTFALDDQQVATLGSTPTGSVFYGSATLTDNNAYAGCYLIGS